MTLLEYKDLLEKKLTEGFTLVQAVGATTTISSVLEELTTKSPELMAMDFFFTPTFYKDSRDEFERAPWSKRVLMAVADLEAMEENEKVQVNMNYFGNWEPSIDKCLVCLAGSILHNTCKLPLPTHSGDNILDTAGTLEHEIADIFNEIRKGEWYECADHMEYYGESDEVVEFFEDYDGKVTSYFQSPKDFKTNLRALATDLAEAGL